MSGAEVEKEARYNFCRTTEGATAKILLSIEVDMDLAGCWNWMSPAEELRALAVSNRDLEKRVENGC